MRVGNGEKFVVLVVGSYILTLYSGLILNLDDFYYAPALTKNIISVSYLNNNGFYLTFSSNSYCIMLNGILYASGTLCNGIYILDMSNPILNVNENKRQKAR